MFNAKKILERLRSGMSTDKERQLVEKWWLFYRAGQSSDLPSGEEKRLLDEMGVALQQHVRSGKRKTLSYAAAALFILAVAFGLYFYTGYKRVDDAATERSQLADIAPGTNRAVLTLADGRTIDLSSEQTGIIVGDGIAYADGSEVFSPEVGRSAGPEDSQLTGLTTYELRLTTPKGGRYQITLPDGTRVWLNAATTLIYPSRFNGDYREVKIEGEGYFDIVNNDKQPFRIMSRGQQTDVLGTEFNIAAYPDEDEIKTTLVSGAVSVNAHNRLIKLLPGQQAVRTVSGIEVKQMDVEYATAWKNNLFVFRQTGLKEVLQSLSRWYDISVDTSFIPDRKFNGRISRTVSLQQVLRMMERSSDLKFKIDGERGLMVIR